MATNMQVAAGPSVTGEKNNSYLYLRDLLREGLIKLPNDPRLINQLKSTMGVSQSGGGFRIVHPRKIGAGHADLVSALVNAAWMDRAKYAPLTGKQGREGAGMMPTFVQRRSDAFIGGSVYGG